MGNYLRMKKSPSKDDAEKGAEDGIGTYFIKRKGDSKSEKAPTRSSSFMSSITRKSFTGRLPFSSSEAGGSSSASSSGGPDMSEICESMWPRPDREKFVFLLRENPELVDARISGPLKRTLLHK